jgi:hypothetical protein
MLIDKVTISRNNTKEMKNNLLSLISKKYKRCSVPKKQNARIKVTPIICINFFIIKLPPLKTKHAHLNYLFMNSRNILFKILFWSIDTSFQ